MMRNFVTMAVLAVATSCSAAPPKVIDIPSNGPIRDQIMESMKPTLEQDIRQTGLAFQYKVGRAQGDYAFVLSRPIRKDGGEIDYLRTHYRDEKKAGLFRDELAVLAVKFKGRWQIMRWSFCPYDDPTPYLGWPQLFGCDRALVGKPMPH